MQQTWNRIAPDLDRALSLVEFTRAQRVLFQQAKEQSWTLASLAKSPDPFPFRLNVSAVARETGMDRPHLQKTVKELVRIRVFVDLEDGRYLINKDYREWLSENGSPRLSGAEISFCMDALKLWKSGSGRKRKNDQARQADHAGVCVTDTQGHTIDCSGVCVTDTQVGLPGCVSTTHRTELAPQTPKEERACVRKTIEERELNECRALRAHDAGARTRESEPAESTTPTTQAPIPNRPGCPSFPEDATSFLHVHTGPCAVAPDWARGFWRKLWDAFGNERLLQGWYEHQRWYPAEAWEAAARVCVLQCSSPRTVAFLEKLAADPGVLKSELAPQPSANGSNSNGHHATATVRPRGRPLAIIDGKPATIDEGIEWLKARMQSSPGGETDGRG